MRFCRAESTEVRCPPPPPARAGGGILKYITLEEGQTETQLFMAHLLRATQCKDPLEMLTLICFCQMVKGHFIDQNSKCVSKEHGGCRLLVLLITFVAAPSLVGLGFKQRHSAHPREQSVHEHGRHEGSVAPQRHV